MLPLDALTTGNDQTAVGYGALGALTTGARCTGIGYAAAANLSTGDDNTCVGYDSGVQITGGSDNTCVGNYAGDTLTTGSNNAIVGYTADVSASGAVHQNVFGNKTSNGDNTFSVRADSGAYKSDNNSSWQTTSDRRIKKNITNNTTGLDKINQITVRNFEYKTEDEIKTDNPELTDVVKSAVVNKEGLQVGSIAQEIEEVLPDVVRTSELGIKSVNTDNLTWYLVNAVKELSTKNDELAAEIASLKSQINN